MNILLRLLAAHPHHVHVLGPCLFIFYMADLADKVKKHQENMHMVRVFIFYMADLADKVEQHQENMHAYADDTQLFFLSSTWRTLPTKSSSTKRTCTHMLMTLSCICTVVKMIQLLPSHGWRSALMMSALDGHAASRLKLNAEKTELLYSAEAQLGSSVDCRCSLAQRLSLQVTTSMF